MTQRPLIRGGWIVRTDEPAADLPHGDLLIEDGTIADIAPSIPADSADIIDASGMLVLPGFVDTHRHTCPHATFYAGPHCKEHGLRVWRAAPAH